MLLSLFPCSDFGLHIFNRGTIKWCRITHASLNAECSQRLPHRTLHNTLSSDMTINLVPHTWRCLTTSLVTEGRLVCCKYKHRKFRTRKQQHGLNKANRRAYMGFLTTNSSKEPETQQVSAHTGHSGTDDGYTVHIICSLYAYFCLTFMLTIHTSLISSLRLYVVYAFPSSA